MRNLLIITSLFVTSAISAPQGTNPNYPSMNMGSMPSPPSIPVKSDKVPTVKPAVMPKSDTSQAQEPKSEPEPSSSNFDLTNIFGYLSQVSTKQGQEKLKKDIKKQADGLINQYANQLFTLVGDTVESKLPGLNNDLFGISNGLKSFEDLTSLFGFGGSK